MNHIPINIVEVDKSSVVVDENGIESNIDYAIDKICSNPPQNPKTVRFLTDDGQSDNFDITPEILMIKFSERLFGKNCSPVTMSMDNFMLLKKYLASVFIDINLRIEDTETSTKYIVKCDFLN